MIMSMIIHVLSVTDALESLCASRSKGVAKVCKVQVFSDPCHENLSLHFFPARGNVRGVCFSVEQVVITDFIRVYSCAVCARVSSQSDCTASSEIRFSRRERRLITKLRFVTNCSSARSLSYIVVHEQKIGNSEDEV